MSLDLSFIDPSMQPPDVPGYVFVTHNSTVDNVSIMQRFTGRIPRTAFLTLQNVVPIMPSTTFVEAEYEPIIKAWFESIKDKLDLLKILERLENGD